MRRSLALFLVLFLPPALLFAQRKPNFQGKPLAGTHDKVTAAAGAPEVAFVNVNVVPMDKERVLLHQTVVVKDARIVALGPSAKTKVPKRAQRIDGRGKYLMPGLADMHVHVGGRPETRQASLVLFIANGVTTVRNMKGSPADLALRREIEEGRVLAPRIYSTGPGTDGNPPLFTDNRVVETVAQAEQAVASDKQQGYDAVKVLNVKAELYNALVAAAGKHGLPVYGHVPISVGLAKVLAARQESIEHLSRYFRALQRDDAPDNASRFRAAEYVDLAKLPALIEATRLAGVWNCPTLVVHQNYVSAEESVKLRQKPSMKYMPPRILEWWVSPQFPGRQWLTTGDLAAVPKLVAVGMKVIKALHDGGARLLLGTDTLNPFVVPGFSIHEELQNFVEAGLTPYQALKAGTSDAAEFLKKQDEFGTVAVGKRADLILLEANTLEDVRNAARRVGVMVNGRWFPEAELRDRLEKLAASYATP